jgi:hypothetical protein
VRKEIPVLVLVLDQIDNRTVAAVKAIDLPALAEGDVRVAIDWSRITAWPGTKRGSRLSLTLPAKSIPGTIGNWRMILPPPVPDGAGD